MEEIEHVFSVTLALKRCKTNEQIFKSCWNPPLTLMVVVVHTVQVCVRSAGQLFLWHCLSSVAFHRGTTCCPETCECILPCARHPLRVLPIHTYAKQSAVCVTSLQSQLFCSDQCYSNWSFPLILILTSQRANHFLLRRTKHAKCLSNSRDILGMLIRRY